MAKQSLILLTVAAVAGGVYFFVNYDVQKQLVDGKSAWKIVRKTAEPTAGPPSAAPSAAPPRSTVRIASFRFDRLDDAKLADPKVADVLVRLLPRFELTALEGVRGKNKNVLIRLIEQINAVSGRNYDFATCPTQQRDVLEHYSAFLFDRDRIEEDPSTVHFVEDLLGRFRIKPLVGLFRVRGPAPDEAFTFALIAVETDQEHAAAELDLLAETFRAVRDFPYADGRKEDDIILLGDLQNDDQHLGQLGKLLGVSALLSNVPTTVRGTSLLDNILLDRRATNEFSGRAEVIDMMREFELTMPGAQEISEHLPIWAEFSIYEGGQTGHSLRR